MRQLNLAQMIPSTPSRSMHKKLVSGLFALILTLAPALFGAGELQAQTTTGMIRGRVATTEGEALVGVIVTATNQATGLQRQALSGENGRYAVMLLPPGVYSVTTDYLGYQAQEVQNLDVDAGIAAAVDFAMSVQAVQLEGISVTADARQLDVTSGSVTQAIQREEIENLPSLGRDFTNYITLSGLVAPDPGETTGGKFSIGGQRASQTSIQIDGVDANSAFFGENRGGSRIPFVFSLESINEFQVITNGYDVEYGQYSGGIVNVVTRGGTNEFEGTAYLNYRGDEVTSEGFLGEPVDDFSATQFAGRVSGPLIRDKLFYLFSLDGQVRREPQNPITQDIFLPGGSEENPAVAADVARFQSILENVYGVNNPGAGYQQFSTTNDVLTLFGRLDWNLDKNNRLSIRHNYANYLNDNEWNGNFDFIYGQSRAEEFKNVSHSFVTELQSVLGERASNVFRFQFASEKRPRQGKDLRPALIVNLANNEQIGYGGTFAAFNNNLEESKFEVINNLTFMRGNHTFKVGGSMIYTNILNQFILRGAGEYRFNSLDEFEAFQPAFFTRQIVRGADIPTSDFNVLEGGLYIQDEWAITRNLTATLGLRWDAARFLEDPARVVEVEQAFGIQTGVAPVDNNNFSPRLNLAWDVSGTGASVVRAGVGYFYGRTPYVLGGNVLQTERPQLVVNCGGSVVDGDADAPPDVRNWNGWTDQGWDNPRACAGGAGASGVPTYTFWQNDFEYPETFKANLGYAHQFRSTGTTLSADLIFSESTNLYTVRNANLRDPQFQLDGEGGRRVFKPEGSFDPTPSANPQDAYRNTDFGEIYVNYNDGRARTFSANFEVIQDLGRTANVRGSYTYTSAYDNSSYSCCTAGGGFSDPTVGAFGPNEIGGIGDEDRAWGPSDFLREHTFVVAGSTELPWGFRVSGQWRIQSGQPYSPEMQGDVNGDGVLYNDRPFIFAPEDVPLASAGTPQEAEDRALYAQILEDNACLGDYVGQIIPRGTCRMPWTNQLDMRVEWGFDTFRGQRGAIQLDLFNVMNGINKDWGRWVGVFGASRNLLVPVSYDSANNQVLYDVFENFGRETTRGANLLLQFSAQIGVRYYF